MHESEYEGEGEGEGEAGRERAESVRERGREGERARGREGERARHAWKPVQGWPLGVSVEGPYDDARFTDAAARCSLLEAVVQSLRDACRHATVTPCGRLDGVLLQRNNGTRRAPRSRRGIQPPEAEQGSTL